MTKILRKDNNAKKSFASFVEQTSDSMMFFLLKVVLNLIKYYMI